MIGIAKGAGMIRPHMATMLAFVFLDQPVESGWWQAALDRAVDVSFNRITVDGEMSTNDTVLAFAADCPNRETIDADHPAKDQVSQALTEICRGLARSIVQDGEGATCVLEVAVQGAPSEAVAEDVAESVANSNLLKTALYGGDPNWGRVFSATGATEHDLDPDILTISMDGYTVYDPKNNVMRIPEELEEEMSNPGSHEITINLGLGEGVATRLTCDLTETYVQINSKYEP
jgi:glutamate N-acetyltransferase/amino-acid N-acetyltransferase